MHGAIQIKGKEHAGNTFRWSSCKSAYWWKFAVPWSLQPRHVKKIHNRAEETGKTLGGCAVATRRKIHGKIRDLFGTGWIHTCKRAHEDTIANPSWCTIRSRKCNSKISDPERGKLTATYPVPLPATRWNIPAQPGILSEANEKPAKRDGANTSRPHTYNRHSTSSSSGNTWAAFNQPLCIFIGRTKTGKSCSLVWEINILPDWTGGQRHIAWPCGQAPPPATAVLPSGTPFYCDRK